MTRAAIRSSEVETGESWADVMEQQQRQALGEYAEAANGGLVVVSLVDGRVSDVQTDLPVRVVVVERPGTIDGEASELEVEALGGFADGVRLLVGEALVVGRLGEDAWQAE